MYDKCRGIHCPGSSALSPQHNLITGVMLADLSIALKMSLLDLSDNRIKPVLENISQGIFESVGNGLLYEKLNRKIIDIVHSDRSIVIDYNHPPIVNRRYNGSTYIFNSDKNVFSHHYPCPVNTN